MAQNHTQLSHPQYYQLTQWLRKNRVELENTKQVIKKPFKRASLELGFNVSRNGLGSAAQACEVNIKFRHPAKPKVKADNSYAGTAKMSLGIANTCQKKVTELEVLVRELQMRVTILESYGGGFTACDDCCKK